MQMIKITLLLSSLFILTACGTSDESIENDAKQEAFPEEEVSNTEEVDETPKEAADEEPAEDLSAPEVDSDFQNIYDELNGKSFIFSSGAGAWSTIFTFTNNGQFSGTFSDADGPEVAVSEFTGQFNIQEEIDEFTYTLELDSFQVTSETGAEEADGDMTITYVAEPHGFQSGSDIFELYLPFKPKSQVSDEYLSWVFTQTNNDHDFLNSFGLYNVTYEFGMEELID